MTCGRCQWFSQVTPVSSTNKTEILLKVALNTITLTLIHYNLLRLNQENTDLGNEV